jgi:hypothetical protein
MSNGGRVTTELDIELAKLKLKAEEAKAEFRKMSKAAEDTKLGEKMEAGMKKSTVNEFRGFKERAEKAAAEAAAAAAAKWKEIVTPAVSDPWRVQQSAASRAMMQSPGGGSRLAMGNVGMQVQDIAVQAQMGTSALTIMAQQGSQLASIFGPTGMIVGGAVAVGGALVMAAKKGDEAFNAMINGAREFHKELGVIVQSGSLPEVIAAIDKLAEKEKGLSEARKQATQASFGSFWLSVLGAAVDPLDFDIETDSLNTKKGKVLVAEGEAYWARVNAQNRVLELSRQEVEIAELKAKGLEKEAAELIRKRELVKEIQKIESSSLSPRAKEELIQNAEAVSKAPAQKAELEENEKRQKEEATAAERRIQLSKQFADAEHAVEVASMTAAERLVDLNRQRLDLERQIKAESNDEKKLQLATERERIEAQIVTSQMAMAKEAENAEKARQERIAGLQKELAGKEKNLSKLENPTPTQTYHTPGAISSQFDWMFGNPSSLVSESTNQNTDAMKELKEEIKSLKEKLAPLTINTTAVYAP